ncbi:MAG TPA: GNAT family N-acetyltransferase [Solirubrobacteraceae bacterium]|jgi:RimJ/RimL family protein N-acetyltransferase|nr:GNAT family N-acetyltransferase [Solirubrobacteraceae bacterium]
MLVRLADGTRVVIRAIRADDKSLLERGLARLSPESSRRRFLVVKSHFTKRELSYLTEVDGERHVAFVAVFAEHPQTLAGVGRFVRLAEDPSVADVAVVVADELQHLGLGTRLGLLLADRARALGVQRFSATMLSDNLAAHRLFAKISRRLHGTRSGEVDELLAELAA